MSHGRRLVSDGVSNGVAQAIARKHADDLVVGECKDGPSQGVSHRRLDYWVLRRSWSKPVTIGYEVKSGRADFLADNKWRDYLPLCNELWFIAEDPKAIQPEELPKGVGLYRLAGTRLVTVRRAVWRKVDPKDVHDLLTYILMCRATIGVEYGPVVERERNIARWSKWLAEREESRRLGHEVAKGLREKYERDVVDVRRRVEGLEMRERQCAEMQARLERLGVDRYMADSAIVAAVRARPWDRQVIESAHKTLGTLLEQGSS